MGGWVGGVWGARDTSLRTPNVAEHVQCVAWHRAASEARALTFDKICKQAGKSNKKRLYVLMYAQGNMQALYMHAQEI